MTSLRFYTHDLICLQIMCIYIDLTILSNYIYIISSSCSEVDGTSQKKDAMCYSKFLIYPA